MLFSTPQLTRDDHEVLAAIDKHRASLRFHLRTPHRWIGTLARQQRARDVQGSNSIEGIHVTQDEALAIDARQNEPVNVDDDWLAVKGYSDAMTYARILAGNGEPLPLASLLALHFMVTSHDLSRRPGRLREGEIFVQEQQTGRTVYTGPDADRVPELLAELLSQLGDQAPETHPFIAAAMAHLNLVMIHPFSDGNGRLSRILQLWSLYRADVADADFVSVEEYLGRNTQAYYDVLAQVGRGAWNPDRDAGPWVEFILTAHYRQAMTILRRVRTMDAAAMRVDEFVERHGLPARVTAPLELSFTGWNLTNARYREFAEVSANVASRDLRLLTDAGVIERQGERRGAWYRPVAELREVLLREKAELGEQFDASVDPYQALRRGHEI